MSDYRESKSGMHFVCTRCSYILPDDDSKHRCADQLESFRIRRAISIRLKKNKKAARLKKMKERY